MTAKKSEKPAPVPRAIVIATGLDGPVDGAGDRYPAPMLPLLDRPFIQHVVEALVGQGILQVDFILSHGPEKIERLLGDGQRWGARFRYHLTRKASAPYEAIRSIRRDAGESPVLLGHADRLPSVPFIEHLPRGKNPGPTMFLRRTGRRWKKESECAGWWTGWAWLPPAVLWQLRGRWGEEMLEERLRDAVKRDEDCVPVDQVLSARSWEDLLEAHRRIFEEPFPGVLSTGHEAREGVRVGRGTRVHPSARIEPPVFIGEDCRVGPGVQVGPRVAVGNGCVIDRNTTVRDSVIFPGSYVGEGLEMVTTLVDRWRLINVRLGAEIAVSDESIVGSVSDEPVKRWFQGLGCRLTSALTLLFCFPLMLGTAIVLRLVRRGPVLYRREVVRLPARAEERTWRTFRLWSFAPRVRPDESGRYPPPSFLGDFLMRTLPALVNVMKGDMSLVGVAPRTRWEMKQLPTDWRGQILGAKPGAITEASANPTPSLTEEALFAAEAYYSAQPKPRHDVAVALRYFGWLLRSLWPFGRRPGEPDPEEEAAAARSSSRPRTELIYDTHPLQRPSDRKKPVEGGDGTDGTGDGAARGIDPTKPPHERKSRRGHRRPPTERLQRRGPG